MKPKFRVVLIEKDGTRTVLDDGLSAPLANNVVENQSFRRFREDFNVTSWSGRPLRRRCENLKTGEVIQTEKSK